MVSRSARRVLQCRWQMEWRRAGEVVDKRKIMKKKMKSESFPRAILSLFAAALLTGFNLHAATVGPTGYTNDFSAQPAAVDFATATIAGGGGDFTDVAGMDAAVAALTAAGITTQLPLATGTPKTASCQR